MSSNLPPTPPPGGAPPPYGGPPQYVAPPPYVPPPVAAPVVVKSKGGPSVVNVVLALAVMVALGGVAFAAGRITAPASASANGTGFPGRGGTGNGAGGVGGVGGSGGAGFGGRAGGAGALGGAGLTIQGTVTEVAADHVTIKLASGATVNVATDGTTTYHQQAAGASSDVAVGKTVQVELSGAGGFGGFGGRGGGAGAGASPPAAVGGGTTGGNAGASPAAPGASAATPQLGPAKDITVVGQ